jgi:hypothetical protein
MNNMTVVAGANPSVYIPMGGESIIIITHNHGLKMGDGRPGIIN